jgi:hypothetical protein
MGITGGSLCNNVSITRIGDKEMREITIKDKLWHAMAITTFMLASIIVLAALFWTIYPYKTADIKVPIEILNENKQVRVGEPIVMKLQVKKYTNLTPKGSVYLKCNDGQVIELPSAVTNRPPGEYETVVDKYRVPERATVGVKCTFNFRNAYQVNPIREIVKDWYSEEFEVIK